MSSPVAVACAGLRHRFGQVQALDGVGFDVGAGEVFGLLGPNGAGKTTTIRVLTTLLYPDEGSARVFGLNVRTQATEVRRSIGYVPQQLSADAQLTGRLDAALVAGGAGVIRAAGSPGPLSAGYCHTAAAVAAIVSSLALSSSSVTSLPTSELAKPHCGLSASRSRPT